MGAQDGATYLFAGEGRSYYVNFLRLLAADVKDKPAAVAIELFNEPFPLNLRNLRSGMFETWRQCYNAIQKEAPGMLVGVMTIGSGAIPVAETEGMLPWPILAFTEWLRVQRYLFFAWH